MNIKFPKISILLSVFNDEKNIKNAVNSILNQTYQNLELLVMDDCSSDSTLKILNSIDDKRVKIFTNEKNLGLTKSLNILSSKSSGSIIGRQDSDDISIPQRIEEQYQFLIDKKLDACTTRAFVKNSTKSLPRYTHLLPVKFVIRYKNPFLHGTLLIHRKALEEVGFYDEKYTYAQDYKLYIDLLKSGHKIKTLNKKLYILNMEDNISTIYKNEQEYYFKIIKKNSLG